MKISEWFDPQNIKHVKGYQHLAGETCAWPKELFKEIKELGLEFNTFWRYEIAAKMAECWIERSIQDHKNNQLVQELLEEIDQEELFYETEHSKE